MKYSNFNRIRYSKRLLKRIRTAADNQLLTPEQLFEKMRALRKSPLNMERLPKRRFFRGIAIQGMESEASGQYPGVAGTDFNYPRGQEIIYISKVGLDLERWGFLWERAQTTVGGPLNEEFCQAVWKRLDIAKANGQLVVLDLHCYGHRRVNGVLRKIGTPELTITHFVDFWVKFVNRFKRHLAVHAWDLCNEPINMPVECNVGTYDLGRNLVQFIPNWNFEKDAKGWTLDTVYKWSPGWITLTTTATGTYDNFTTQNDAESAYPLKPNTDYFLSLSHVSTFTGNYPQIMAVEGSPFPNPDPLASLILTSAPTEQRVGIKFTTGATGKTYIRFANRGGIGTSKFGKINITEGATIQPYRDYAHFGKYSTTVQMMSAAINAIAAIDKEHWIWMETDRYSGPHQFRANFGTNPRQWWPTSHPKVAVSYHYYPDPDHSGTFIQSWTQACRDRINADLLPPLDWHAATKTTCTFGEIGWPSGVTTSDIEYRKDADTILTLLDNRGVTVTYFALGDGFTSATSLQPVNGVDAVGMATLLKHRSK